MIRALFLSGALLWSAGVALLVDALLDEARQRRMDRARIRRVHP